MKLCMFANYDKDIKFFDNFHVVKDSKENYIVGCVRSVKKCKDPKILSSIAGKQLYFVGEIDDCTGVITPCKEVVIDYDQLLPKEEVSEDDPT